MTNVLLFIVVFLLFVIIGGISTLIEKIKEIPDWIKEVQFEEEETQLKNRHLRELENTEFTYGHNVEHTGNDGE
jgi:predicted PurR-regulated permease PerM